MRFEFFTMGGSQLWEDVFFIRNGESSEITAPKNTGFLIRGTFSVTAAVSKTAAGLFLTILKSMKYRDSADIW